MTDDADAARALGQTAADGGDAGPAGEGDGAPLTQAARIRILAGRVGACVREARGRKGLSRNRLAALSGVSLRYLAQIETGQGNTSIGVLLKVCEALDVDIADMVGADEPWTAETRRAARLFSAAPPDRRRAALEILAPDGDGGGDERAARIALTGLRGAGKSTLGRRLAERFGARFVELNHEIETESGMRVGDLIALYGQEGYRRLEAGALDRVAAANEAIVLAVAGGIVSAPDTYDRLLARFHTIWLKAGPDEHMDRVRAQGDHRPMAGNPAAMDQLRSILTTREDLYARARFTLDTSGKSEDASAAELEALIAENGLLDAE